MKKNFNVCKAANLFLCSRVKERFSGPVYRVSHEQKTLIFRPSTTERPRRNIHFYALRCSFTTEKFTSLAQFFSFFSTGIPYKAESIFRAFALRSHSDYGELASQVDVLFISDTFCFFTVKRKTVKRNKKKTEKKKIFIRSVSRSRKRRKK